MKTTREVHEVEVFVDNGTTSVFESIGGAVRLVNAGNTPQDRAFCQNVLNTLRSERYLELSLEDSLIFSKLIYQY